MNKKKICLILLLVLIVILVGVFVYIKFFKCTGRIELYLHDSSELPVRNANVALKKENGDVIGEVKTGQDGKITYYNVKADSYIIEVLEVPEGYEIEMEKEHKLEVLKSKITTIDIECKRTVAVLAVTIVNSNDEPIKGVTLDVYDEEGYKLHTIDSDADGKVYVEFPEDGVYYFRQSEEQEDMETENLDMTMYKIVVDKDNRTFYKTIKNV